MYEEPIARGQAEGKPEERSAVTTPLDNKPIGAEQIESTVPMIDLLQQVQPSTALRRSSTHNTRDRSESELSSVSTDSASPHEENVAPVQVAKEPVERPPAAESALENEPAIAEPHEDNKPMLEQLQQILPSTALRRSSTHNTRDRSLSELSSLSTDDTSLHEDAIPSEQVARERREEPGAFKEHDERSSSAEVPDEDKSVAVEQHEDTMPVLELLQQIQPSTALKRLSTPGPLEPPTVHSDMPSRHSVEESTPTQANFPPSASDPPLAPQVSEQSRYQPQPPTLAALRLASQTPEAPPNASNRSSTVLGVMEAKRIGAYTPDAPLPPLPRPTKNSPRHGPSLATDSTVLADIPNRRLKSGPSSPTEQRPFSFIQFGSAETPDLSLENPVTPVSAKQLRYADSLSGDSDDYEHPDREGRESTLLEDKGLEAGLRDNAVERPQASPSLFKEPDIHDHPAFRSQDSVPQVEKRSRSRHSVHFDDEQLPSDLQRPSSQKRTANQQRVLDQQRGSSQQRPTNQQWPSDQQHQPDAWHPSNQQLQSESWQTPYQQSPSSQQMSPHPQRPPISGYSGQASGERSYSGSAYPARTSSRPDLTSNPSESTTHSSVSGKKKKRASFFTSLSGQSDRSQRRSGGQMGSAVSSDRLPSVSPRVAQQQNTPNGQSYSASQLGIQQSRSPRQSMEQSPTPGKQKGHKRLLSSSNLLKFGSNTTKSNQAAPPPVTQAEKPKKGKRLSSITVSPDAHEVKGFC
jgi:hypothetical protein